MASMIRWYQHYNSDTVKLVSPVGHRRQSVTLSVSAQPQGQVIPMPMPMEQQHHSFPGHDINNIILYPSHNAIVLVVTITQSDNIVRVICQSMAMQRSGPGLLSTSACLASGDVLVCKCLSISLLWIVMAGQICCAFATVSLHRKQDLCQLDQRRCNPVMSPCKVMQHRCDGTSFVTRKLTSDHDQVSKQRNVFTSCW